MTYMLVRHKVADISKWKSVFDWHAPARRSAGLTVTHLLRNVDDPNEVFLLLEVADIEKAKAFVNSPDASEAKQRSGVVDTPDLYFLH